MQATVIVRKLDFVRDEGTDDERHALVVHVHVDCESCGEQDLVFSGHHAAAIFDGLKELIEETPELTQAGGTITRFPMRTLVYRPEDN